MSNRTVRISGVTIDTAGNVTDTHEATVTLSDPPLKYTPDEPAELAYWRYDALVRGEPARDLGDGVPTRCPMSDRDAFKRITRPLYDAVAELVDFAEGVMLSHDAHPFIKNEARNVARLRSLLQPQDEERRRSLLKEAP